MNTLAEQIHSALHVPLSETGKVALQSFLTLPGVLLWSPENLFLAELSRIFDIGLPFSLLINNTSAEMHRRKISNAIVKHRPLLASLWSEVQVGALLSNWGANVKFIGRKPVPTPDLQVKWGDGVVLDTEVTRAEPRKLHKAIQIGLQSLGDLFRANEVTWNIIGFFADASNQRDLYAALDAAITMYPGETREESNRWTLRAIPLEQRENIVGARACEIFGPGWWPVNAPNYFETQTVIGGHDSPVIQFRSLIPITSYMNPIVRKAEESGQWNRDRPYLIAVDVSEMPRAHERIIEDLNDYFLNLASRLRSDVI